MTAPRRASQPLTKARMGIRPGLPLEVSDEGGEALRRGLQLLMDIEAIKQLKHAYFRCIDTANFEELEGLFHEDVSVHFIGGFYEWKLVGRAKYLESIRQSFHRESNTRYERIYEINRALDENPVLSTHYLGTFGTPRETS